MTDNRRFTDSFRKFTGSVTVGVRQSTDSPMIYHEMMLVKKCVTVHTEIWLLTVVPAQQVPKQPIIEPARARTAPMPLRMMIPSKHCSIILMSSQLSTVNLKEQQNVNCQLVLKVSLLTLLKCSRVRTPDTTSYVGWVCCFFVVLSLRDFSLGFPSVTIRGGSTRKRYLYRLPAFERVGISGFGTKGWKNCDLGV